MQNEDKAIIDKFPELTPDDISNTCNDCGYPFAIHSEPAFEGDRGCPSETVRTAYHAKPAAGSRNAGTDDAAGGNAETGDATPPEPKFLAPETDIFKLSRILVEMTFIATAEPTRLQFECTLTQNQAAAELRQTFYAQPEAKQTKAAEFEFYLDYMSHVCRKVRGWLDEPVDGPEFAAKLREVGVDGPFAWEIASSFFQRYLTQTRPVEFFR
jgi:hypothetical protein